MKDKKVPIRTCVVTREALPKRELLRIVRTPIGNVEIDTSSNGKMNGRGAYIKRDVDVITKAQNKKILNGILKVEVPDEIYEEAKRLVKEG